MKKLRILLCSNGFASAAHGNFGLPNLVALGSYLEDRQPVEVTIFDSSYESLRWHPDPELPFRGGWDVVGLSCYTSFEFRRTIAQAHLFRRHLPSACIVVGGYHASARPQDFFIERGLVDYVVVGEGERPLETIVASLISGTSVPDRIMGPDPLAVLDELPLLDWRLLSRYHPSVARVSEQLNINLSRGCPYRCSFCMEQAKASRSWRAYSPERAELELARLGSLFDLRGKTVRISDALFGFDADWRRDVLDRISRLHLPVRCFWTVTRADLLAIQDLEAFRKAGFGLGFGLESGDPGMLSIIRKGGLEPVQYLSHFSEIAARATEIGLPWGANLIVGHPGETPASLTKSATWVANLWQDLKAPTGFLSVDPYRFYPGSRVDEFRGEYETRHGTRSNRPDWWQDEETLFSSTWIDASRELDYAGRECMRIELFRPIVEDVAKRFSYDGLAVDYFRRTVDFEVRRLAPESRDYYTFEYKKAIGS